MLMPEGAGLGTREIIIETMSPLHVGTKEIDYGWGILKIDRLDDYAYIVDQDKFLDLIKQYGLIDKYCERFADPNSFDSPARGGPGESWVLRFLQDEGVLAGKGEAERKSILKSICSSVVSSPSQRNPFIRSGSGNIFLPGSSVKGALRTAVAYGVLKRMNKDEPVLFDRLVKKYTERKIGMFNNSKNRDKMKERFAEELMSSVFYPSGKYTPYYDLFKAVKISDGILLGHPGQRASSAVVLTIGNSVRLKTHRDGRIMEIPCEYVPAGVRFKMKMVVDWKQLELLYGQIKNNEDFCRFIPYFTTLGDLLETAKNFASDQWGHEREIVKSRLTDTPYNSLANFYKEESAKASPLLRLGWATGMLGTTIDLLLGEELRRKVRDLNGARPGEPAPKSRRLLRDNQRYLPFGWVKLVPGCGNP